MYIVLQIFNHSKFISSVKGFVLFGMSVYDISKSTFELDVFVFLFCFCIHQRLSRAKLTTKL